MAEPVNPKASAVPPAVPVAPVPAPAAPAAPRKDNPFLKALARSLTSTFFFGAGLALIALAVLLRFHPGLIPSVIQPVFDRFIPRLPYFVTAFGLLFLGQARNMVAREYAEGSRKNKQFPHAWKIPLIATQAFLLQFLGFLYAFSVGVGWAQPIKNLIGLLLLLLVFFAYVLWYIISHFQHHFPSVAALRVALLGLFLAGISFICWTTEEMVLLSLFIGLFALVTALTSMGIYSANKGEQQGVWVQIVTLLLTIGFLLIVGAKAFPFGESRTDLLNLGLTARGIEGTVGLMSYSNNGKKIAFAEKNGSTWFAQIMTKGEDGNLSVLKVPAGEEAFRPVFVEGGRFLLLDAVKNGSRGVWRINPETGSTVILRSSGVEPFGDGLIWSAKNHQLLFVNRTEDGYQLESMNLATGKAKKLFSSSNPILSPSWTDSEKNISYADGSHGLFYVFDTKAKEKSLFMSDLERAQGNTFVPEGKVIEAIPAPDGFRYLYITEINKEKAIWVVRADGTHRDQLYETSNSLQNISWHPDAQRIVFEEKYGKLKFWFLNQPSGIKILDANLGNVDNLIPPQISHWSPAVSPDGVKIAFAASDGLWYPSFGQGVWVAVLR